MYYRNKRNAVKYYTAAIADSNRSNEFVLKSRLDLAIIYHELKNHTLSQQFLNEILDERERGSYRIKARNLLEYYKY